MFNHSIGKNKTVVRVARQLAEILNHKVILKPSVSGSNSKVDVSIGDMALPKVVPSPGQAGIQVAANLIHDGGELIRAPMKWVQDIQANWITYIVCAAIICICILFFYYTIRTYLARRINGNSGLTSQLADIASTMANITTNHHSKNSNAGKQLTCGTAAQANAINE